MPHERMHSLCLTQVHDEFLFTLTWRGDEHFDVLALTHDKQSEP
jgi:hypothetical protein